MSRKRIAAAAGLLAMLYVAPVPAQNTDRDVYVSVIGKSGIPIVGLGFDFFAIREDGRDREVLRAGPAPQMHLALLVDTSSAIGSAAEPYRNALASFVGMVSPGNRVALYEFGSNAIQMVPFTDDVLQLKAGIARVYGRPDTVPRLIDATEMACNDLKALGAARPVIVVVSVSGTENSARTAGGIVKQLIELPAAFYVVAVTTAPAGPASPSLSSASGRDIPARQERMQQLNAQGEGDRERTQLLIDGTAKTGGALYRVASSMAVGAGLDKISAELAAAYRVTFSRPAKGKMKDLQVGVMVDDVAVRATAAPSPK